MVELTQFLRKVDISKVELADYLGISRQMLYNYLGLKDINDWPKHQRLKLYDLLKINEFDEIFEKKIDLEYIEYIEGKLQYNKKKQKNRHNMNNLSQKQKKIVTAYNEYIIDNINELNEEIFEYNLEYLKSSLLSDELKYFLVYISKLLGKTELNFFEYDKNEQYVFESIIYSAFSLYKTGGYSMSKIDDFHSKFEKAVNDNISEKQNLSTELSKIKKQALKELGFDTLTADNAEDVFIKIAEIQARKI